MISFKQTHQYFSTFKTFQLKRVSSFTFVSKHLAGKGIVPYLLKKSTKLTKEKKPAKQFSARYSLLKAESDLRRDLREKELRSKESRVNQSKNVEMEDEEKNEKYGEDYVKDSRNAQ